MLNEHIFIESKNIFKKAQPMQHFELNKAIFLALFIHGSETCLASKSQADRPSNDESRAAREEQIFYLTPGVGLTDGIGVGFRFGYFLTTNHVLEYSTNAATDLTSSTEINQALMIRSFLGNSFNIALGINKRREESGFLTDYLMSVFDNAIERSSDTNITGIKNHITATDYGVQVFLGNQWQWKYMTIGIDWVGYYHPLKTLENKLVQDISYKDGRKERRESELKPGKNLTPSVSLMWLHTGISF